MSDVHRVLSPPALLSSCRITCPRLLSRSQSIHLISGLPLVLLSCFPSILVFSKDPCPLTMSPKQNGCSLVISATSDVTGLICSRTHPFFFFFWSSLPTPFQMNHFFFFLSASFTVRKNMERRNGFLWAKVSDRSAFYLPVRLICTQSTSHETLG